ncbi:MAG: hydroxymethylglutaryl-CoA lyase [Acidobacteriota bacterium]
MTRPAHVTLVEVGPRDGFQIEKTFIPTDLKIGVIDAISAAGVRRIEATAFVSPKVVPQLQDAAEVMRGITRRPGVAYAVLVPNRRGAERAVETRPDVLRVVIAATDEYNRRNLGRSVDESFAGLEEILALARAEAVAVDVVFGLSFGCPLTGPVPEARVEHLARRAADMGIRAVAVADSYGFAHPRQVASLMARLRSALPGLALSLHLHDTRGLGLANVLAAMSEGIDAFEASLGGLGGAPNVEGATGNISTEDVLHMCDTMGVATGVDLEAFMAASKQIAVCLGRELPSRVLAAGTRDALFRRIAGRTAADSAAT